MYVNKDDVKTFCLGPVKAEYSSLLMFGQEELTFNR